MRQKGSKVVVLVWLRVQYDTRRRCAPPPHARSLPVVGRTSPRRCLFFIAGLLVVAKDGLMNTQPSILASTADSLWPNTAACCRVVRPTDTQLLLVLCATRLLVVVGS